MRHRFLSLSLALLLLITQQLGAAHLLSHVLQLGGHGPAAGAQADHGDHARPTAPADGTHAHTLAHADAHADTGDALCQVCLVLATLLAAALPTLWHWCQPRPRAATSPGPAARPPAPRPWAPYHARGPPRPAALT